MNIHKWDMWWTLALQATALPTCLIAMLNIGIAVELHKTSMTVANAGFIVFVLALLVLDAVDGIRAMRRHR